MIRQLIKEVAIWLGLLCTALVLFGCQDAASIDPWTTPQPMPTPQVAPTP